MSEFSTERNRGTIMSTPTLSPVSGPPTPRPVRWTCAEFHRFGDLGLVEGRRALLIDGVILEQGPMNPPHAVTLGLVEEGLRATLGPGWWLRVQMPLILGQHTDPEPDVAVVPGRPRDYTAHPTTAALVVEVADSSLKFDTTEKRGLYAAAGIREYWVVDVNGRVLLVYRDPHPAPGQPYDHDYATQQTLGASDTVAPLVAPTVLVSVADLLP
jgi:Uma2 family endonuclease